MSLEISFELSDKDLDHFKQQMAKTREAYGDLPEEKILEQAASLLTEVEEVEAAEFIKDRVNRLEGLIDMVKDRGWALEDPERGRVLSALSYFADPEDMIHDSIPGLGYLDDAIMIELICRELAHELEAYADFCQYREAEATRRGVEAQKLGREDWLETRRKELQSDMRRRRREARSRGGARQSGSAFSLW